MQLGFGESIFADSCVAAVSILAAIIITMIGVGIERPNAVVQATVRVGFAPGFQSATNVVFAYGKSKPELGRELKIH